MSTISMMMIYKTSRTLSFTDQERSEWFVYFGDLRKSTRHTSDIISHPIPSFTADLHLSDIVLFIDQFNPLSEHGFVGN